MKKKYKLKKSAIIIMSLFLILLIALVTFIISLFKTKSYSYEYNLNEYKISENYDNKEKLFYYEIIYKDTTYNFIYYSKYLKENKLIKKINKYEEEDYICLTIESEYINTYPLCSYKNSLIDVHLVPSSLQEQLNTDIDYISLEEDIYDNYKIYNKDNKLFIWSYKGFNYINNSTTKFIKIFDEDIYDIPGATKINEYIIIPDYEQKYNYNRIYILNMDTLELDEWNLKYEISFDSYVLGYNDKSVYIVDKKNEIEYELVPHRKKMRIVGTSSRQGIVYENGESKKISIQSLISNEKTFIYHNNYQYFIEDNYLYLSYLDSKTKIKVSNQIISSIVYIHNDDIYYLVKDTLYKYNLKYGETKLVTYSEWERNNNNLIFINDQN